MRVIAFKTLREFWKKHADIEQQLRVWYAEAEKAEWLGPNDIKVRYPSASFVGNDRVVFNIKGNKYRLIVAIRYHRKIIFIRFIGTHAEYDRINAETV